MRAYPKNGRNKLDQEVGNFEERWIKVVEEVDQETLDMGAIVVLEDSNQLKLNISKVWGIPDRS